jgi:septum site-determining protein MinD
MMIMVRIIDICSGKGGVGKTTVAVNLGVALQKLNKKVAVVDCNITTSHLGLMFGIYNQTATLNDLLKNESKIDNSFYVHSSGLRIVPASLDVKDIVNIDTANLRQKLKDTFSDYDYVLLDSAPSLGKESMLALQACDEVLFVANPHMPSLVDIVKCHQLMNGLENKPSTIGIILNRVKNKYFEIKCDEIGSFTNIPIIGVVPEDDKILAGVNKRTLVTISDKNASSSSAFFKIASRIAGEKCKRNWIVDMISRKLGR